MVGRSNSHERTVMSEGQVGDEVKPYGWREGHDRFGREKDIAYRTRCSFWGVLTVRTTGLFEGVGVVRDS